jgi:hypothetical protein
MRGNHPHEQAPEQERGRVLNALSLSPDERKGVRLGVFLLLCLKWRRSGRRAVSM